jgi:glyoxalase family protein
MLGGLHHVTAIAGDPQHNLDFYTGVLGLRLVKRTVNYDDPGSYHFYFAPGTGEPGTLLTFFPWPSAPKGYAGAGNISSIALSVPRGSLGRWRDRLRSAGVACTGDPRLAFTDPEGLRFELLESDEGDGDGIVRVHSVRMIVKDGARSHAFLERTLGLVGPVEIDEQPEAAPGKMGRGLIHHVAWRVADEAAQAALRTTLIGTGLRVSPVKDRHYFHSIYFREPGGVLFEVATDGPGFLIDESAAELGRRLCLPPWLEPIRDSIEARLPALARVVTPRRHTCSDR